MARKDGIPEKQSCADRILHLLEVIGEYVPIYEPEEFMQEMGIASTDDLLNYLKAGFYQHRITRVDQGLEKVGEAPMIITWPRSDGFFEYALYSRKPEQTLH